MPFYVVKGALGANKEQARDTNVLDFFFTFSENILDFIMWILRTQTDPEHQNNLPNFLGSWLLIMDFLMNFDEI